MKENEWIEKELPNGDIFHIARFNFYSEEEKNKPNSTPLESNKKIRINKISKANSSIVIYLTNNDNLVGYVECWLYDNNVAVIGASALMNQIIYDKFNIKRHDRFPAINTEINYRRQGKGVILLIILFEYLISIGINEVNIDGITDNNALKFYLASGLIQTKEKYGIFKDIESLLPSLYEKVGNQLGGKIDIFENRSMKK